MSTTIEYYINQVISLVGWQQFVISSLFSNSPWSHYVVGMHVVDGHAVGEPDVNMQLDL